MNNLLSNNKAISLNPKHFELIVYPTEQCNFRCSYCYEDFEIGRMTDAVIQGTKQLISKRVGNLDTLYLSWFGGEPLIARDIVLDISQHAFEACNAAGTQLSGGFTTNGYHLTVDLARKLSDLHQRNYQISLDGYQDGHDQTRKLASGSGTFKKIWGNLINLHESNVNFKIMLRLHVTRSNIDSIRELAYQIKDIFLPDPRFSIFLKAVGNWGGDNKILDQLLSKDESELAIAEIKHILYGDKLEAKSDVLVSKSYICYASRPNSLAVRANGLIQKCTVMLKDERNNVGKISTDGSIAINQDVMQMWMRGYSEEDNKVLACPAKTLPSTLSIFKNTLKVIPSIAI